MIYWLDRKIVKTRSEKTDSVLLTNMKMLPIPDQKLWF